MTPHRGFRAGISPHQRLRPKVFNEEDPNAAFRQKLCGARARRPCPDNYLVGRDIHPCPALVKIQNLTHIGYSKASAHLAAELRVQSPIPFEIQGSGR